MDNFEVIARMCKEDNQKFRMAPFDNIAEVTATKKGDVIHIGVESGLGFDVIDGKMIGGLLLIDKEEFNACKARYEAEPPSDTVEAKIERFIEAGYSVESGRGVNDYWLDVRKNGVGVSKHLWFKTLSEALDDALKMAGMA